MRIRVIESYQRPYDDPIKVSAGEPVVPDLNKLTDIEGWIWCTSRDGRSGWAPRSWLKQSATGWCLDRAFDAMELTISRGEVLEAIFEESGFYWARRQDGESGWVPCRNVSTVS
jgi:hypothetical protein